MDGLNHSLRVALWDIAHYTAPYCWKPRSMDRLAKLGLVEPMFKSKAGPVVHWRLTEKGWQEVYWLIGEYS